MLVTYKLKITLDNVIQLILIQRLKNHIQKLKNRKKFGCLLY